MVGCCAKIRSLFTSSPQIIRRRTKGFFVASRVPSDHRRRCHGVAGGTEEPRWRDRWASCTTVCRVSHQASHRRLKGFSDFLTTGLTKITAGYILASRNRNNLFLLMLSGAGGTCSVLTLFSCQTTSVQNSACLYNFIFTIYTFKGFLCSVMQQMTSDLLTINFTD